MIAEVVSVGTELLLGQIVDTDAVFIAKTLSSLGINIYHRSTVGDNPDRMRETIQTAVQRADLVITIGGLGPTMDDLTKEISADVLGIALIDDPEHKTWLQDMVKRRGSVAHPEAFLKQALVPASGRGLKNPNGTALGSLFEKGDKALICLPGPPNELIPMVEDSLVPYLTQKYSGERAVIKSKVLRLVGIGESIVEERVKDLMQSSNPSVAPYAKTGEVHLRITSRSPSENEALEVIAKREAEIRERLTPWIYGTDEETLEFSVVSLLLETGKHVATAESCTGGLISKRITDIPDSSKAFDLGIVAYANHTKVALLGVYQETLDKHGAVSPQTAAEMAIGIRRLSGATIGVSSTGIAGPGGGTAAKPVGTVYIAIATEEGVVVEHNQFLGQRIHITTRSSQAALALIRNYLIAPNSLKYEQYQSH